MHGAILALEGVVSGHPGIGDERRTRTSALVAFELTGAWARTISRFYRLGRDDGGGG